MSNANLVVLIGNVTKDLELRKVGDNSVTDLGVAVNHQYKNKNGESVEDTVFVDVVVWNRTAELCCEYLKKGSQVYVEGRLKLDTWEKDGSKHSKLRVVANRVQFIGAKSGKIDKSSEPELVTSGSDIPF